MKTLLHMITGAAMFCAILSGCALDSVSNLPTIICAWSLVVVGVSTFVRWALW